MPLLRPPAPARRTCRRSPPPTPTTPRSRYEEGAAFLEKLAGVRSIDKALEVQTDYAKTAYETFVAESTKIGELYKDIAKETYKPFEGFMAKMPKVGLRLFRTYLLPLTKSPAQAGLFVLSSAQDWAIADAKERRPEAAYNHPEGDPHDRRVSDPHRAADAAVRDAISWPTIF